MVAAKSTRTVDEAIGEAVTPASNPKEAFGAIKELLKDPRRSEVLEVVYEKLRSVVFHMLASRESGQSLTSWGTTLQKVRALTELEDAKFSERFVVLGDLLEQAFHFKDIHSIDEILRRKHVVDLIKLVGKSTAGTERKTLGAALSLGEANLSRILSNLEAAGVVERESEGRQVNVKLTDVGRKILRKACGKSSSAGEVASPFRNQDSLPYIQANWPSDICGVAVTREGEGVLSCDSTFSSLFDLEPEAMKGMDVPVVRRRLSNMIATMDEVKPDEVDLADGRTFTVREVSGAEGCSIWIGFDVSDYKRRLEDFARREQWLKRELDALRNGRTRTELVATADLVRADTLQTFSALRQDVLLPLTSISNSAFFLHSKMTASSEELEAVANIVANADKTRRLFRTLLAFGDTWGHSSSPPEHFMPAKIVDDVLQAVEYTARHSAITFKHKKFLRAQVQGDRTGFEKMLTGILANFVELVGSGGSVDIASKMKNGLLKFQIMAPGKAWGGAGDLSPLNYYSHIAAFYGATFVLVNSEEGLSGELDWPAAPHGSGSRTRVSL